MNHRSIRRTTTSMPRFRQSGPGRSVRFALTALATLACAGGAAACGSSSPSAAAGTISPTTLPRTTTTTTANSAALPAGTYQTVVTAADLASVNHDPEDVAGTWRLVVGTDATLTAVVPGGIQVVFNDTVVGSTLSISPDIKGVCTDTGTYTVDASRPNQLVFHLQADPCSPRAELLPLHPWMRASS